MKYIKQTLFILLAIITIVACNEEDPFTGVNVTPPSNLQMNVQSDANEVGLVKITPTAEGASYYKVDFGDDSEIKRLDVGQSTTHQFTEGTYTLTGAAFNIMGDSIQATQSLTVAFDPPSDLVIDITIDPVNTNVVTVTPTATNAMSYDIYFGDVADETPTIINDGASANHSYTASGDYTVRVVARSGSTTTVEASETVSVVLPAVQLGFPIDFESDEIDYGLISFGNAELSIIDNPDMNGNESDKVVQLFKANGAEVWAGGVVAELPNPIDFSTETALNMDVWSPKRSTYYFDNINLGEGGNTGGGGGGGNDAEIVMPIDFEADIEYSFSNFGNATTVGIDNPDASGENTSTKVGHLNKASGSEVWAGSFIDVTDKIDVSAGTTFTMKTWSPKAGIQVLLKIENKIDNNIAVEIPATNTVANEWETLSFDFSDLDATQDYGRVVLFFDFGNTGDGSDFYFDDITQL